MYWVNTMVYTKTELYRTNTKSQGLVPAYFALIISIVVHVVKHQSVLINTCRRQESQRMMQGSPSQLNCSCYSYPSKPRLQCFLRLHCGISKWLHITATARVKARARTCTPLLCAYLYCVYALVGGAISIRDRISVPFHESVPKNRTLSSTGPLSVQ